MFDQYPTIDVLGICQSKSLSVLGKFRHTTSPSQLVQSLIKPFSQVINDDQAQIEQLLSCLEEDKDVLWIMEVIGYGLRLPLSDQEQCDAVRDCVNIYHEWFQALCPADSAGKFIPKPIRQDPNLYCQKIVGHFYNIFLSRSANSNENIALVHNKQAVFCHRILRLIIKIAANKNNVINAETWETLLIFLLGINKELLQGPVNSDLIGTIIAERVINTLFECWLLACSTCFPSFSHWKTLQHVCVLLRHRPSLIIQWNRVNICLTNALVKTLYDSESKLELHSLSHFTSYNSFVQMLSPESLRQCWFRFLHIIGNPIELCFPEIIFKHKEERINQTLLPFIFHKAIKGICILVDIFLGVPNIILEEFDSEMPKFISSVSSPVLATTPQEEKRKSNFSLLPKASEKSSSKSNIQRSKNPQEQSYELPTLILPQLFANIFQQNRVKSTSILDIFGKWLFQASLISSTNIPIFNLLNESFGESDSLKSLNRSELNSYSLDNFETGQAEAIGALCRIFCFKRIDEDISLILSTPSHGDSHKVKNYMTSYYLALKLGLSCLDSSLRNQLVSSILVNSVWFFEVDLPGSKILIPHFLKAIEIFLTKRDKSNSDNDVIIRRACIKILTSLLSFPSHFRDLPIRDTLSEVPSNTFLSLYPKLIILLIHGLHNENDSHNVQLIFSALLFIVEDIIKNDQIFSAESESEYEEILSSFHTYFKFDGYHSNQAHKGDIPSNLFLVIVTFVSEILCKSSSTDSTDYNIPLTALEILSSFGRMIHPDRKQILCNEKCKLAIKQIFIFIENQCYRKPKYHSRDMHSTIVAAYQCLSLWFHEHDHLLQDQELIVSLFELIELGISGSKSKKDTLKSDKELKPTSMRVKEAAESLLMTLMERVNPNRNFSESSISLNDLNEQKIVNLLFPNNNQFGRKDSFKNAKDYFRFFVVDNNMIVSILEDASNDEETVCILRTPHGKHCWILKYEHIIRRPLSNNQNDVPMFRSIQKSENLARNFTFNYFPEFYDQICTTRFDNSVLNVTDYVQGTPEIKQEFDEMLNLIDKIEGNLRMEKVKLNINSFKKELNEPLPSKQFDVSRLIFSQFKMFNSNLYELDKENKNLMTLNANGINFIESIERLDLISTKNNDIVFLFYVPSDFKTENDIFSANQKQFQANSTYREFALSLGPLVYSNPLGFYWSDIQHELLFVSPIKMPKSDEENPSPMINLIKEDNEVLRQLLFGHTNIDNENAYQFFRSNTGCDIKLVVFYLENYNDLDRLPFNPPETTIDFEVLKDRLYVIAIAPQKNGLYKVVSHFLGNGSSIPLINERMLLSKYLIATYIRITALNLMRRHRMTNEGIHMPHVKRRNKMQEIINKYKIVHEKEDLISSLFKN